MKIGIGYDVHKLVENRELIIGGVHIPYERGLEGHSDADVLIHAMMDSILGALGKRDIGYLFPDNDKQYENIDSKLLLKKVFQLMKSMNFQIGNIDSIIIAQNPKMSNYIDEMRLIISQILDTNINNVSIKATTTEKLGFEGKGYGIAAQAVCILEERCK